MESEAASKKTKAKVGFTKAEINSNLEKEIEWVYKLEKSMKSCLANKKTAEEMNEERKEVFKLLRSRLTRGVQRGFMMMMTDNGLEGTLSIKHNEKKLIVRVKHLERRGGDDDDEEAKETPLSNLSGGERSKTLVCLILALWDFQKPPFR